MGQQITITTQKDGVRIAYVVDGRIITSEFCRLTGQGFIKDTGPVLERMSRYLAQPTVAGTMQAVV